MAVASVIVPTRNDTIMRRNTTRLRQIITLGACAALCGYANFVGAQTSDALPLVAPSSPAPLADDAIAELDAPENTTPFATEASFESANVEAPTSQAAAEAAAAAKKKREALKKAVAGAYKPLFYDNDFKYIDNPLYDDWFLGDSLKRMDVGRAKVDIGGQFRVRFHDEHNMRSFGLAGVDDTFVLTRTRLFANVELGDELRIYAEGLDAQSHYEHRAPRSIEENRFEMLNLFADVLLFETGRGKLTFRGGRQELLYGAERLVSPLDWANTRRTFEGYKTMWVGEDWKIDSFYTRPVLVNPQQFDSPTYQQQFFGTYATYKKIENQTIDLYWLSYNNDLPPNHFRYQTLGTRWLGSRDRWLWETEAGTQFGENTTGTDHSAMYATVGLGRKNEDRDWKPTLWAYYDYASGGAVRGAGQGMNHLFPLAHKYLGFMDLYGRSNIESPNVQLTLQPHEKVKLLFWYYYFFLEDKRDTPYNINMTAFNPNNTPASRDLGHEIDFTATYTLNPRMDILFGYSHFFAGKYYKYTPGLANRADGDFLYTQFQWNY